MTEGSGWAVAGDRTGRAGRLGLLATGLSVACTFLVAIAGPSVMEPVFPGRSGQLPWALDLRMSGYLAVGLTALGVLAGAAGLILLLRAIRGGWTVDPRVLLLGGLLAAVALTLIPPFGSSDPLSYVAYGRMVATGHNPYLTTPANLAKHGDPMARAMLEMLDWPRQPSDYGPLASGIQGLASQIAGQSVRLTVFLLDLVNLVAFTGTALLLYRMTAGRQDRRLRAMLLWTANPLLLQVLVAGGHLDTQQIVCCVAAVAVLYGPWCQHPRPGASPAPGRAALAGALIGLGFAIKVTAALVGLGLAIALVLTAASSWPPSMDSAPRGVWRGLPRPGWHRLAVLLGALAAGFAAVAGGALAIGGRATLTVTSQASDMVSNGSPWRAIRHVLQHTVGHTSAKDIVKYGAIALAVLLAALTLRAFQRHHCHIDGVQTTSVSHGSGAGWEWGRWTVLALVIGWLFAWPYILPWYDALGWVFLALVPTTGLDWLMLARTTALGLAYLPARTADVTLPHGLRWVQPLLRNGVSPVVLTGIVAGLIVITIGSRTGTWNEIGGAPSIESAGGSYRLRDVAGRAPARRSGGAGMYDGDRRLHWAVAALPIRALRFRIRRPKTLDPVAAAEQTPNRRG
jgi:hypothetical protein